MSETEAKIELKKRWGKCRSKPRVMRHLRAGDPCVDPNFSFRARAVPGWAYYPLTDTVAAHH